MTLKYITWETSDGLPAFVVFPQHLRHRDMLPRDEFKQHVKPVGAGFVDVTAQLNKQYMPIFVLRPYGSSDSLGVASHPSDSATLNP